MLARRAPRQATHNLSDLRRGRRFRELCAGRRGRRVEARGGAGDGARTGSDASRATSCSGQRVAAVRSLGSYTPGRPPPSGVLSALYASAVIDEVAMNGTGDSQDGTDVAGAAEAIENNNEGAAAAASAISAPAIPPDLPKDAASDREAPPPPPLEVKLLYRRQAAAPPQASAPAKDGRASGQKRGRQNSDTATPQARGETPSKQEVGGRGGSAVGAGGGSTDGNEQAVAAAGTGRRKKRR